MKKKTLAVLLSAAMLVTGILSGCGGGGSTSSAASSLLFCEPAVHNVLRSQSIPHFVIPGVLNSCKSQNL